MENSLPPGFALDKPSVQASGSSTALPAGFELDEDKYGGVGGELKSAALGAADTLTFGGSTALLTKTGLVKPETIKGLEEENPASHAIGAAAGLVGAHLYGVGEAEDAIKAAKTYLKVAKATGNTAEIAKATEAYSAVKNTMGAGDILNPVKAVTKAGSAISKGLGGGILGHAAAAAAEGAAFGVGNTVSEQSLGDPDTVAESLMHNMGYGALIGGGLGTTLGVAGKGVQKISKVIGAGSDAVKAATRKVDQILGDIPKGDAPILDPVSKPGIKPTSLEEIAQHNAQAMYDGQDVSLPQKAVFEDAASRVEMNTPFHPMQVESLDSQSARDNYRIIKEMPGEHQDALNEYETRQKKELVYKTDKAIEELSPNHTPTADAIAGGQHAADAFTEEIQKTRNELGPKIGALKKTVADEFHLPGVIQFLTDKEASQYANPKLAALFDTSGKEIKLKPWDSGTGIEKKTWTNIRDMLTALKKDPNNFERLFSIRDTLGSGVNLMESGKASSQLTQAKAALMDYIQSVAQRASPDAEVREWFKKYAINEENAKIVEKKFGAEIGDDNWRSIAKNKPQENILDNIFRDSESVKAARAILSPDKFNELLANHLAERRALATKDGAFSSNKFYTKNLAGNKYALAEAFAGNPEILQKLTDYNTLMRVLPDAPPVNPSGTAKTLLGSISLDPTKFLEGLKQYGAEKFQKQQLIDQVNQKLAGNAEKAAMMARADSLVKRTANQITDKVKSIFSDTGAVGFTASKLTPEESKKKFTKLAEKITSLNNDPNHLLDKLAGSTKDVYAAAPGVASSVQALAMRTTQFLATKLPMEKSQGPLSDPMPPSLAEIAKFDRYLTAVDSPVGVLDDVKRGTISQEALEALQVVHPKLYMQMKQSIFSHMAGLKDRNKIPYQTKMAVSRFMGEPLDETLKSPSILMSQMVYAQPTQEQQMNSKMTRANGGIGDMKISSRTSLHPNIEDS